MRAGRAASLAASAATLALCGCATQGPLLAPAGPGALPPRVELVETPFFPQRDYQCGPAALATVLAAAGVSVPADDLVAEVYLPGRRGSLQAELIAATRSRGLLPYVVPPSSQSLLAQVAAGRPVLVLQKTGAGPWPGWHYAVVVGYDTLEDRIVLRSGTDARLEMSAARFLATWDRADRWALVVVAPGDLPADPDFARYMQAAAGLEATGRSEAARAPTRPRRAHGRRRRCRSWGSPISLTPAATSRVRSRAFDAAIERAPGDAAARNNRATVLLALGCPAGGAPRDRDGGGAGRRRVRTRRPSRRRDAKSTRRAGPTRAGCPPDPAPAHSPP